MHSQGHKLFLVVLAILLVVGGSAAGAGFLSGHRIKPGTIGEAKLTTALKQKINASASTPLLSEYGPAALAQRTSKLEVKNKAWTGVPLSNAVFDTNGGSWSAESPMSLKATQDGVYVATGMFAIQGNATGARVIAIFRGEIPFGEVLGELSVDGRAAELPGDEGGNGLTLTTFPFEMKAGETIKLGVFQSSGGALNLLAGDGIHSIKFGFYWIRPF